MNLAKINSLKDIDKYLIYFMFLEMLFLRWILIGQDKIILYLCIILVLRMIFHRNAMVILKNKLYLLLLLIGYILLNSFSRSGFTNDKFLVNLNYLIPPLIVIVYFGYIIAQRLSLVETCFLKLRVPLNIYYIINFFVILEQRGETYFLMPVDRIRHMYYPDHMAGLLGIDGTHRLALVTVFVILVNMYYTISKKCSRQKQVLTIIYIIITIITAFYTSALNDNNMVYLLIPIFIFLFYMLDKNNTRNKWFKVFAALLFSCITLYIVANSSLLTETLGSRIGSVIKNIFTIFNSSEIKEERAIYVLYSLVQLNGWFIGQGFGTVQIRLDPSITALGYDYRNWGMSDIASLIAIGGLIFYIAIVLIYSNLISHKRESRRIKKYVMVIMFLLTYYHQVFTHVTMMIPMCWIIALFVLQQKEKTQ